jgi:hypothetical protein
MILLWYILMFSKSEDEHWEHVKKVLKRLQGSEN